MKKDEALQRREKLLVGLNEAMANWVGTRWRRQSALSCRDRRRRPRPQRLSRPGKRPDAPDLEGCPGHAGAAIPSLVLPERKEVWIGLLCSRREPAGALSAALRPLRQGCDQRQVCQTLPPAGEHLETQIRRPTGSGVSAPVDDKLDKALEQLIRDTMPALDKILAAVDP